MESKVKVKSEGKLHFCAVIGSEAFRVSYTTAIVDDWIKQLKFLSIIAELKPQSAYSTFVDGYKGKLTYLMSTILSLGDLLKPLGDVIRFKFIPAITCGHWWSDNDRILLSLPVRFGGLEIPLFHNDAKYEYGNSRKLTQLIKDQNQIYSVSKAGQKSIKSNIKINKEEQ